MATPAQVAANRANAQKSTGPRSVEGKFRSRFNALQHGVDANSIVIPGEDPEAYESLAADYRRQYHPSEPSEHFHVESMIQADWLKRRALRLQADLHRILLEENPGASLAAALLTESKTAKLLAKVQRQIAAHERAWYRAHNTLHRDRARDTQDCNDFIDRELGLFDLQTERQLASIRNRTPQPPSEPAPPPDAKPAWPPIDPETGHAPFFVG
jgi:hypothetical protein